MADEVPVISLRIPGQSEPLVFGSPAELEKWRLKESNFWDWLRPISSKDGNINNFFTDISSQFSNLHSLIRQYQSAGNNRQQQDALDQIQNRLTDIFTSKVLLSSSPGAQFVNKLKEQSPFVAAYVLWGLIHREPFQTGTGSANGIKGIALATLFQQGLANDAIEAHQNALTVASEQWRDFQSKADNKYLEDQQAVEKLLSDADSLLTRQEVQHEAMGNEAKAKFDQIAKTGQEQFAVIQKTYNEQLGLQAPVQYWEDRASRYLNSAIIFSIASGVLAVVYAIGIWAEIQWLVIPYSNYSEPTQFGVHAWRYAFVIASAAFFLWPIRILVRILLSSVHLRIDAQERATLAKTYLAFLRSKEGLEEKDRQLIFEVLFRPSSTGIIKDDASPGSLVQVLSRLGSGDKK